MCMMRRVPLLMHARDLRVRIASTLAALEASGPEGAVQAAALREQLLRRGLLVEGPHYWSLAHLEDISKGQFAELPGWLEGRLQQAQWLASAPPGARSAPAGGGA